MKITKVCWYKTRHWNVLPAIILLNSPDGFILQVKFANRHFGLQFSDVTITDTRIGEGRY